LKKNLKHIDPELPESLGQVLSQYDFKEDFNVPEHFFKENADLLKSLSQIPMVIEDFSTPENFFEEQNKEIIGRLDGAKEEEWATPPAFFGELEQSLKAKIERKGFQIFLPWIYAASAAAVIVSAIFIFAPDKSEISEPSFTEMLEQIELSPDDMELFAETEDYCDLYLETSFGDTLVIDSLTTTALDTLTMQPSVAPPSTLKDKPVSFDDLTEEEILNYLLEEGGDDVLNDL